MATGTHLCSKMSSESGAKLAALRASGFSEPTKTGKGHQQVVAFPNSFWLYDLVAVSATTTTSAAAVPATTAAAAAAAAAASRLAGLGLVDGQRASTGLLTV